MLVWREYQNYRVKQTYNFNDSRNKKRYQTDLVYNFNSHLITMKRILKMVLKSSPKEFQTNQRGLSTNPISQSKKNTFGVLFGLALGLYIGQYFPDIYFETIQQHLPQIQQLKQVAPKTQSLKPKPLYPKSLFSYPQDALQLGKNKIIEQGFYEVKNDVTKVPQQYKFTKVARAQREEQ